jgi:putative colanic acid biosynthesis acetyltransferase WcaF
MSIARPYIGENCVTPGGKRRAFERMSWAVIEATLFRWSPRPFHRWRAWLLRLFGANISNIRKVVIFPTARIAYPRELVLEDHAMIGPFVKLYNLGKITICYGANISQNCHLCAGTHDFSRWDMPLMRPPIVIGTNAWLAADVFVGPGVEIGELSVVGARSVVVKNLPASHICVGNPCRPIKPRPLPQLKSSP